MLKRLVESYTGMIDSATWKKACKLITPVMRYRAKHRESNDLDFVCLMLYGIVTAINEGHISKEECA